MFAAALTGTAFDDKTLSMIFHDSVTIALNRHRSGFPSELETRVNSQRIRS